MCVPSHAWQRGGCHRAGEQPLSEDQLSLFNTSSLSLAQSPWGVIACIMVSQLLSWNPTAWKLSTHLTLGNSWRASYVADMLGQVYSET